MLAAAASPVTESTSLRDTSEFRDRLPNHQLVVDTAPFWLLATHRIGDLVAITRSTRVFQAGQGSARCHCEGRTTQGKATKETLPLLLPPAESPDNSVLGPLRRQDEHDRQACALRRRDAGQAARTGGLFSARRTAAMPVMRAPRTIRSPPRPSLEGLDSAMVVMRPARREQPSATDRMAVVAAGHGADSLARGGAGSS